VGLSVYPPIVARQWPGKHVPAAKEELLEAPLSMRSVSYRREIDDQLFPDLLVMHLLHEVHSGTCLSMYISVYLSISLSLSLVSVSPIRPSYGK
jgi:hypothetical protein